MSKLKFTPDMFHPCHGAFHINADQMAANICNAVFDKWLSSQPKLYQMRTDVKTMGVHKLLSEWIEIDTWPSATHSAYLCCIEELPKKECEHEAVGDLHVPAGMGMVPMFSSKGHCKKCGIPLKATWSPA